jgi:hypothetical protein
VVRLSIKGTRVLAVGGLLVGFLGQWWHVVAEGRYKFYAVMVGIEIMKFGDVAEMGVVGYGGVAVARTEALASALAGTGFRCCTRAL